MGKKGGGAGAPKKVKAPKKAAFVEEIKVDVPHYSDALKDSVTGLIAQAAKAQFDVDLSDNAKKLIRMKLEKPKMEHGELAFPCFVITRDLGVKRPNDAAQGLGVALASLLEQNSDIMKVEVTDAYLNFFVTASCLANIIPSINANGMLNARPNAGRDRVMIEFSQPNTHKVFHVGHMRNCALGSSLVHFFEHVGFNVVAANYFGDEGAHVAKCLWYLQKDVSTKGIDIDKVKPEERAEFLGKYYSLAVDSLDLSAHTTYPFPGVFAAKVLSIGGHPSPEAPANWHLVKVGMGPGKEFTVVCGGEGYKVGDIVAYTPVGQTVKGKPVEPKDMKGVASSGIMMARRELGLPPLATAKPTQPKPKEKGKKKGKVVDNSIFLLPADTPAGTELIELGRKASKVDPIPAGVGVAEEVKSRTQQVRKVLLAMEHGDKAMCALWNKTKKWSLDEFKKIYKWLDCRFDHDFYESEVGEESLRMVDEYRQKGLMKESDGCVGMDLEAYGLGFCMFLKSNGSGLYATKDLSLAKRKFEQYKIDKSIYVVDAAQTLHFKQVFKTLELMGFKQAERSFHLPYGVVVLPDGKMSSRKGNVIFFSDLKQSLADQINRDFLDKYKGEWPQEELDEALQKLSVATIKYGMLNHDTSKDIVFDMQEWTAKSGNTGVYMMYAYARIKSILREVKPKKGSKYDGSLLNHPGERVLLSMANEIWPTIKKCVQNYNTSAMCMYLFDLAKAFSSYYEAVSIKKEANADIQASRLQMIEAVAAVLKTGLQLLGISTLDRM